MSTQTWSFNHAALRDVLDDIGIDYTDGWDTLSMRCFMDETCLSHRRHTLGLKCDGDKAGVWFCLRCERRGYIDQLVCAWTGWHIFRAVRYLNKHQAYEDPNDIVRRTERSGIDGSDDDVLRQFAYRHQYLYDRGFDEETCLRYRLGFDREFWMITIPLFTPDRKLAAIKKRAVTSKMFQYLQTDYDRYGLFGIDLIKPRSVLWITEGEFDAMSVDQMVRAYDFPNQGSISLSGKHLSERALEYIIDTEPSCIVDALDNDSEGRDAAKRMYCKLAAVAPVMQLHYETEQTKDPNESTPKHLALQARRAAAFVNERNTRCQNMG